MTVTPVTELFVNGAWTDISGDVYNREPVTITRGRADEGAQITPSTCTMTLNNRAGKYSPRNPNSPYFGSIGRNTPIRFSFVHNGTTYRRFTGEVSTWPLRWDLSGADVWVPIQAAGIIRRLGQGRPPALSALTRHIKLQLPGLVKHWPLEDDARREGVPDGAMSRPTATPAAEFGRRPIFGEDAGPPGTAKSLLLRPTHQIILGNRLVSGGWSIQAWVTLGDFASDGEGGQLTITVLTTDGSVSFAWSHDSGAMSLQLLDGDGFSVGSDSDTLEPDGPALITLRSSSTGTTVSVNVDQLSGGAVTMSEFSAAKPYLSSMRGVRFNNSATFGATTTGVDMHLSHVTIGEAVAWNGTETRAKTLTAGRGHAGETAGARIERLCVENNIALQPKGNLAATEAMGPQPAAALLELFAECATVDMGILHEPRDALGLAYRTRASMYDQVT